VKCELHPDDRAAAGRYFVKIEGLDSAQLTNFKSGETTMMANGAMIMDGVLSIPSGASIEFGSHEGRRRLSKSFGEKKVLAVRADTLGSSTISSKTTIAEKVFGYRENGVNMRSQYIGCSFGKIDLVPFEGTTATGYSVTEGVIEVSIDSDFSSGDRFDIESAILSAAESLVGDLDGQFDHVMLCVPPGIGGSWIAYAYGEFDVKTFSAMHSL